MEIIALQQYTDKYVSLYEGEIRNLEDSLATQLIEKEIVAEHSDDSSGESGNGDAIKLLQFIYNPSTEQGGFIKQVEDNIPVFYTFDEILEIYNSGTHILITGSDGGPITPLIAGYNWDQEAGAMLPDRFSTVLFNIQSSGSSEEHQDIAFRGAIYITLYKDDGGYYDFEIFERTGPDIYNIDVYSTVGGDFALEATFEQIYHGINYANQLFYIVDNETANAGTITTILSIDNETYTVKDGLDRLWKASTNTGRPILQTG